MNYEGNKGSSDNLEHKKCCCSHEHSRIDSCHHEVSSFGIADMSEKDRIALKEKEEKLKMETGKDFILIAYEKK